MKSFVGIRVYITGCTTLIAVTLLLLATITLFVDASDDQANGSQHGQPTDPIPSASRAPIFREADHEQQQQQQSENHYEEASIARREGAGDKEKKDATLAAVQARLMKELRKVNKCESLKKGLFEVELKDENLQEWNVKLFYSEGSLHEDLAKLKELGKADHIMLQFSFGDNYPAEPPFVRVVYPVLVGPQVHKGGALCLDLLMGRDWLSAYSVESVILMIIYALDEHDVRVKFAESMKEAHYSDESARLGFEYMKGYHEKTGWY